MSASCVCNAASGPQWPPSMRLLCAQNATETLGALKQLKRLRIHMAAQRHTYTYQSQEVSQIVKS